jgi:hypothetical protein
MTFICIGRGLYNAERIDSVVNVAGGVSVLMSGRKVGFLEVGTTLETVMRVMKAAQIAVS